ncbi:SURF1 family protein [Nocardioides sp. cx-173]|uniref:SURF1 family protein n=1 Tax=Nocardioides sp. cx-173 TaxID=2898796 RepID=UPI001E542F64|nr:SURF1 family protein [Nocardioides sp. cx-173]MCD4523697.1 SURF1 family protein [Nocardioides sp. cx-173]UGB41973.1 SURF1 family protein [Nocardioides sp. cx-173]
MRAFLTPRMIGAHLLALVCVGIAGGLGVWQFDAWQRTRAAEAKDLTQVEPVPLTDVMGSDDPFPPGYVGHPVEVSGTWLPDSTVFVSGREVDGVEGFWVVTPLAVGDADAPALPVVRGWSPTTEDVPAPPTGTADLVAWLQPTEGTGQVDDDPRDDVLPQMRTGDLVQHVDQDLYGAYGVATEPLDGLEPGTLEQLPSPGSLTGLRNFLYALEWWVFGAFAAFIWWRYVREESLTPEPEIAEDRVRSEV